jgi:hypothetical protein
MTLQKGKRDGRQNNCDSNAEWCDSKEKIKGHITAPTTHMTHTRRALPHLQIPKATQFDSQRPLLPLLGLLLESG